MTKFTVEVRYINAREAYDGSSIVEVVLFAGKWVIKTARPVMIHETPKADFAVQYRQGDYLPHKVKAAINRVMGLDMVGKVSYDVQYGRTNV